MKRYYKLIAICLIFVLSFGMLSACAGQGEEGGSWDSGMTGPVQNNGEDQTQTPDEPIDDNEQDTPGANENDKTPGTDDKNNGTDNKNNGTDNKNNATDNKNNATDNKNNGTDNKNPGNDKNPTTDKNENETPNTDSNSGEETEKPEYTIKCMSFNLLAFLDASGKYSTPQTRAPWQVATIKKYDPDLLGCQESSRDADWNGNFDTVGNIEKNFPNYAHYSYNPTGSNSMFWKKDRFDLIDSGFASYGGDQGVSWVKLFDRQDSVTLLFTNVHLTPTNSAARIPQATFLFDFWKKNCGSNMPLYGTGDYNCKSTSSEYAIMASDGYISSGVATNNKNANPGIDHVFINGEIQTCHEFHTCMETFEPAGVKPGSVLYKASDHWAVVAYCSNKQ